MEEWAFLDNANNAARVLQLTITKKENVPVDQISNNFMQLCVALSRVGTSQDVPSSFRGG